MTFKTSVATCFCKYVNFQGRASRSEFWWFAIFIFLVKFFGITINVFTGGGNLHILIIAVLILLIPYLSVRARRLHDMNKSGWWVLLNIMILGQLALLIMCILPGTAGPNKYGINPLFKIDKSELEEISK